LIVVFLLVGGARANDVLDIKVVDDITLRVARCVDKQIHTNKTITRHNPVYIVGSIYARTKTLLSNAFDRNEVAFYGTFCCLFSVFGVV
jgi:Golgi nucleoside diphosphatase